MFSIFKKRKEPLYQCLGVRMRTEGNLQEDMESCFQVYKSKLSKKFYTRAEIDHISQVFAFDVNEYYVFEEVDLNAAGSGFLSGLEIIVMYRWLGSKLISEEEIEIQFTVHLSKDSFYLRTEIEEVSEKIGCDVFGRNHFYSYIIHTYKNNKQEVLYRCIVEPEKPYDPDKEDN